MYVIYPPELYEKKIRYTNSPRKTGSVVNEIHKYLYIVYMNLDLLVILCAGNFTNYRKYTDFLDSGVYIGAKTRMESGLPLINKAKKFS